jgi:hypothetical protein
MQKHLSTREAEYIELRKTSTRLVAYLIDQLPGNVLDQAAEDLDLLRHHKLKVKHETELLVLMDHALYDIARGGESIIRVLARSHPAQPGTLDRMVLDVMVDAKYSLFLTLGRVNKSTIEVHDVLRDQKGELIDFGLAECMQPGMVLAGRYLAFAGGHFWFTSGTWLPVEENVRDSIARRLLERFRSRITPPVRLNGREWAEVATLCLRLLLRAGAAGHVRFEAPEVNRRFAPSALA